MPYLLGVSMKDLAMLPEYISRVDHQIVQALQIRMISLDPQSGRMTLKFTDGRFPPMITCAREMGVPAPGNWLVKTDRNEIEFKSDLEFQAEFKLF